MPHTPIIMGTPQSDTTKILRVNKLSFDGGGRRDKGLLGSGIHDRFCVEGSGVGGDGDFLLRDTVHSGEFVSGFDAVIGGNVIITYELEEEGGKVNLEGIGVNSSGFFHFSADIEPVGMSLEAVEGRFGGILGALIDVHISGKEGALVAILVTPDSVVAFLVRGKKLSSFFCEFF